MHWLWYCINNRDRSEAKFNFLCGRKLRPHITTPVGKSPIESFSETLEGAGRGVDVDTEVIVLDSSYAGAVTGSDSRVTVTVIDQSDSAIANSMINAAMSLFDLRVMRIA